MLLGKSCDYWGNLVREAWIEWAMKQPDPKPSWLVPYADLSDADKEADRWIGEVIVWAVLNERRHQVLADFNQIQEGYFEHLARRFPRQTIELKTIEQRLEGGK